MRYELQFYLCCCKSFLKKSAGSSDEEDFYAVLGVSRDATTQEVKHAYKQCSLRCHPDKLAQRGQEVTEKDRERFNRIKDAHEVLTDPRRRETYDVVGEQGLKWIEEPFSIDPTEAYRNFANSSIIDRSKIFLIFVATVALFFIVPVLICMHVDGDLGEATWVQTFTPVWILDVFLLFHHSRMLTMGPIQKPDDIPEEEWTDPLPMNERKMGFFRFALKVSFEIMLALKLDDNTSLGWGIIFLPIWIQEALAIRKVLPLSLITVMTLSEFGTHLGKQPSEITDIDKFEAAASGIAVVPFIDSPETLVILKAKEKARSKLIQIIFRDVFLLLLILQLDDAIDWSWWLIFLPIWVLSCIYCCSSFKELADAQEAAATLFQDEEQGTGSSYGAVDSSDRSNLTEEEKEILKEQLQASSSQFCNTCCNLTFLLLMVCLLVGKANGAGYSAFWIISPLLTMAGIILCCLGCAIYCIQDLPDDVPLYPTADNIQPDYVPPIFQPTSQNSEPRNNNDGKVPEHETVDLLGALNNTGPSADVGADMNHVAPLSERVSPTELDELD